MKKHVFSPKNGLPPASYDVISRNHSNWPPLNLSKKVHEGWTNSYWKRLVLMFYPLGKNSEKTLVGAWGGILPPPPVVRPRVKSCNIFSVYILATTLWREASELFLAEVYRSKIFHQ